MSTRMLLEIRDFPFYQTHPEDVGRASNFRLIYLVKAPTVKNRFSILTNSLPFIDLWNYPLASDSSNVCFTLESILFINLLELSSP